MSIPPRSSVKIGSSVCIVRKCDQPTGKITIGNVKTILTASSIHPHGIKVELVNGSVGRVQSLSSSRLNNNIINNNNNNNNNSSQPHDKFDNVGISTDTVFRGIHCSHNDANSNVNVDDIASSSGFELSSASDRNNRNLLDFIAPNQLRKFEFESTTELNGDQPAVDICYEENFQLMKSILSEEFNTKHLMIALIRCNNSVDDAILLCIEQGYEGMNLLI